MRAQCCLPAPTPVKRSVEIVFDGLHERDTLLRKHRALRRPAPPKVAPRRSALAAGCSQLRAVTFKGCCNITHIGLRVLFEGCPQLKSLTTDYSFSAQDREYEWQLKRKYPSSLVLLRTQVEYNTYGDFHDEEHSTFNMLINIITLILRVLMSRILRISFSRT